MKYTLPELEYSFDALEPFIGAKTVEIHYTKHHQKYIDTLNASKYGKSGSHVTLEEIICKDSGAEFNNAGQIWNHNFYWKSMRPNGGGEPAAEFKAILDKSFGSVQRFKDKLADVAKSQFGSGWAWLAVDQNREFKVLGTSNAENPMQQGLVPLLTLDVWEHAYYLDYQNERAKYVTSFLDNLVNWQFVEDQYNDAISRSFSGGRRTASGS